ncbi:MAG: hypothetical protein R6U98_26915, partial [Pirellulaceae bacterium]
MQRRVFGLHHVGRQGLGETDSVRFCVISLVEPSALGDLGTEWHAPKHTNIFQAVGFFRVERCPTQAVLPLVGLAAENVIRDRYISGG